MFRKFKGETRIGEITSKEWEDISEVPVCTDKVKRSECSNSRRINLLRVPKTCRKRSLLRE